MLQAGLKESVDQRHSREKTMKLAQWHRSTNREAPYEEADQPILLSAVRALQSVCHSLQCLQRTVVTQDSPLSMLRTTHIRQTANTHMARKAAIKEPLTHHKVSTMGHPAKHRLLGLVDIQLKGTTRIRIADPQARVLLLLQIRDTVGLVMGHRQGNDQATRPDNLLERVR